MIPSTSADVLGKIGSDVSFAVTLQLADEVSGAASDMQLSESAVLAFLFAVSICIMQLLELVVRERKRGKDEGDEDEDACANDASLASLRRFGERLTSILLRIASVLTVRLLAEAVVARQEQRGVRIASLLSVTVFFVLLERGGECTR